MKLMATIRQRIGRKLFISYLIIILVGVISLAVTAEFFAPSALDRHMASMTVVMGDDMGGMMGDLTENFQRAINEVLLIAALAATVTAVLVSSFVTRRIVSPIEEMTRASQRIADGGYDERVHVVGEDELGELAGSFNQMAQTLAQTEERRRQLIGDVAHELRTPLSSIRSVMEGLIDEVLPAEPTTFLSVQNEVSRLQRLVHDLEELSRAEAGQIPLEMEWVDPQDLIRTAAERLHPQYDDKGVKLSLELAADLPQLRVDRDRMAQVLLNLMGNALQYTPSSGEVTVRARPEGSEVAIIVQDTGEGIPAEHLSHVFERFYRADKSRSRAGGGSGIGLTISKHIIEAHGGRITASSPGPNRGSTFTITLPINQ
ncbi:MAG: ATP-binding protein [Candidatus Promineifilaceae bacterium]